MLGLGRAFLFGGRLAPLFAGMAFAGAGSTACNSGNTPPAAGSASAGAGLPASASAPVEGAPPDAGDVEVTLEDDGRTIDVAPGRAITFRLPRNAGTGYAWRASPVDAAVLSDQGGAASASPGDASTGPPGSPRVDVHRFVAVGPGAADITLSLARSFGAAPPARTLRVSVHVR